MLGIVEALLVLEILLLLGILLLLVLLLLLFGVDALAGVCGVSESISEVSPSEGESFTGYADDGSEDYYYN